LPNPSKFRPVLTAPPSLRHWRLANPADTREKPERRREQEPHWEMGVVWGRLGWSCCDAAPRCLSANSDDEACLSPSVRSDRPAKRKLRAVQQLQPIVAQTVHQHVSYECIWICRTWDYI